MSLVADYGTSSESESDSDSSDTTETLQKPEDPISNLDKLPKPDFGTSATSVFSNPFIEAENAKQAILEKHVKMVPTKKDTTVINGKKICWNYRKGRCRFGHKCAFAHDSDLQKTEEELESSNNIKETVVCQNSIPENIPQNVKDDIGKKKKRPGLTQGLTPGKKVMKMFNKQQNQPLC